MSEENISFFEIFDDLTVNEDGELWLVERLLVQLFFSARASFEIDEGQFNTCLQQFDCWL